MLSKVYINEFKTLRREFLPEEENSSSNDENDESRFKAFFDELNIHKEEVAQIQMETLSTSDSSSSKSQAKIKTPKKLTIDILKILSREDRRTTVMIKNIPNKFSRELLLNLIDQNFKSLYDMFILPTDSKDDKNYGYAFINFTHSLHIAYFYHLFHDFKWNCTNSKKICQISYSKIQGKSKLKKHYPDKSLFINEQALKKVPSHCFMIPNIYKNYFVVSHPNAKLFPSEQFSYCYI